MTVARTATTSSGHGLSRSPGGIFAVAVIAPYGSRPKPKATAPVPTGAYQRNSGMATTCLAGADSVKDGLDSAGGPGLGAGPRRLGGIGATTTRLTANHHGN